MEVGKMVIGDGDGDGGRDDGDDGGVVVGNIL